MLGTDYYLKHPEGIKALNDIYINKWIERMDQNKEMFSKVMDDEGFSNYLKG